MEELHPRLAVDLGTTWTAASRVADSGVEAVPLGSGHPLMPSVVARDGEQFVVGEQAERLLDLRPESGAREIKRRFGDTTPVVIDGQPFGADALMAEILRDVARVAFPGGWSDVDVVLTHPANWGAYKLELLTNIGQQAGFRQVVLQSEPVAAATHFVETGRVNAGDVVAVYDFGGGTFDAAVVRVGDDASVLGTPQGLERLGGIDVDQMVFAHVAASLDGTLSQLDSTDPDVRRGVARVRAECTKAKEALSSDSDAMIAVSLPTIKTKVRITRPELESILRQRIDETLATLDRAIASAGMTADDLAAVALIGGSSQIPLVAERVRAHVGRPTLFGNDPKLVVAFGALEGALRSSGSATAMPAAAAAKPDELSEETSPSGAASPEVAAAAAAQSAHGASTGSTVSTPAEGSSRAPAPPPAKPVESHAGRIAGGVAGAAAAVAGGIMFHEQLAAATGIDPQVGGDVFSDVAATAAAAASAAGSAATLRAGDETGDDADRDPGVDDVDTQRSNVPADTTDDSMDAFDDNPLNEPATVDLVGGSAAGDGDAATGGVRDAFTAEVQAAAAEPVSPVATPEPAFAGNAAPPIDDFSSVVGPPSDPPDTLGPKVGFSAPSNRPTTHQADPDGPVSTQRAQPPANPAATAAPPHSPAPPTVAPAQAVPQPAVAAAADAHGAVVDASSATAGPNDDSVDDDLSTPPQHDDGNADNADFDAARARLLDRVAHLDPPAGASDQQVADLKADLQQMIDRFEPRPGESTDQALAALRAEYDDRVRDFTQDQKIDALIKEERRDNARETPDSPSGETSTQSDEMPTPPPADIEPTTPPATVEQEPPPVELHADATVDQEIRDKAKAIFQTMETERRETFAGKIQEPAQTMQFYANQQMHLAALQQLINDQQEAALGSDGGMPADSSIDRINSVMQEQVAKANAAMTQASQMYAAATGGIQAFTPPPLPPVPIVMPAPPDLNPEPQPEPASAAAASAFDVVAGQVAAANQAMAAQAMASGVQYVPIQVPLDPGSDEAPDLAAINLSVAQQVANANAVMAAQAAALGRPIVQIPVPTITLPEDMLAADSAPTDGDAAAGAQPDPGDAGAMGESAPDAAAPDAFDVVAAQLSDVNAALANQAAAAGVGFTPIQVPLDPANGAPDLAEINALVAQQVSVANAQIASQAASFGRPAMTVPTPTITLPEEMMAGAGDGTTTGPAATEDETSVGAAGSAAATPNAASQATYGAADDATYGKAETAAYQGAAATNEPAAQPSGLQAPEGAADAATAGTAGVAAYQSAGTSSADVPASDAQLSQGTLVASAPGGAAGVAAQQDAGAGGPDLDARDSIGFRAPDGDTGFVGPDDLGQVVTDALRAGAPTGANPGAAPIDDPFDAQQHTQGQPIVPDNSGLQQVTDAQVSPAGGEPDPQLTGGAGSPTGPSTAEVLLEFGEKAAGIGSPTTQILGIYKDELDVLKNTGLRDSGAAPDPNAQPGGGGAAGPVDLSLDQLPDLPDVPDVPNVPDILGNVDPTNTMQAPTGGDPVELPTIPDITPADVPAPPPPPAMPDLDLPEIPAVPDVPVPDIPVPDVALPALPDLPDAPDFSSDGPSFGDDIGSDVTPTDPTTTDF